MSIRINKAGLEHAKSLINSDHYVKDSDWSEAQPSTDDENSFLEGHNWKEYSKWFLAEDTEKDEETKERYKFPYGDFNRVHRSGVIAAKQRAAQFEYPQIEKAADDLLQDVPKPE